VLQRTYFMAVIDGVFCLDARVTYKNRRRYQTSRLSGVRLWALITLQTLVRD